MRAGAGERNDAAEQPRAGGRGGQLEAHADAEKLRERNHNDRGSGSKPVLQPLWRLRAETPIP